LRERTLRDKLRQPMRLSFVVPTRNQARFLRQCLDCCVAQKIDDSEIVVVDGASTDETKTVLSSYDDRVRWTSEADSGQSEAINKGVRAARGELIAWINSDDYYASNDAVGDLLAAFDRDPALDIVYGDGLRVDVAGRSLGRYTSRSITSPTQIVVHPASFVQQPSLIFRRQLFLDVGGLDESLHYAMDYDLWTRLFAAARATCYVPLPISCARYHADAKSIHAMGAQIRELVVIKHRAARRLGLGLVDRVRMAAGESTLAAYWLAVRLGLRRAF
jgi:glycosyltransferase involved in cell wall biosynthesis